MGIRLANADRQPELVFDGFFMNSLSIDQTLQVNDTDPPKYTLKVGYQLFAVDEHGVRHYKPKVNFIVIDDYYTAALTKAQQGDFDLANAMGAIEKALATIITDQTELGNAEIV